MLRLAAAVLTLAAGCSGRTAAQPAIENETPAIFKPLETGFDYAARHVDIPMRDGVKLHAVILTPKGATHAPILLTRTPYNAEELTAHRRSSHLVAMLDGYDNASEPETAGRYIRVVEDVRGKHKSEGDYVMNRPWKGPLNPSDVDHPTDTYDTIEWLVHNVSDTNGRVGLIGISYDGFTALMGLIEPHPALKAVVPINPMVDGWIGDDWFHRGAFRQINLSYVYEQEASRDNDDKWWRTDYDDYAMYLAAGSAGAVADAHGMDQLGFYRKLVAHPAYDSFWQEQAVDRKLAEAPLGVPTLLVHSLWDQEDSYGALAVYKALRAAGQDNGNLYLAIGPWHHGQAIEDGSALGAIRWGSDTALWFRRHVLANFLDHNLQDDAPALDIAPVTAFESGTDEWRRLPAWPAGCEAGCSITPHKLFLSPGGTLRLDAPDDAAATAIYVSDPAKPVPFHRRPVHFDENDEANFWPNWLAEDQRDASTRTDVLTFTTDKLVSPFKLAGEPIADLEAATTGTDGDFVVKLIDEYPEEVPRQARMGGYQFMVSADIMRGRYRESYSEARPIARGQRLRYRFSLPAVDHVFLPGHRIMVQVQSSWFPLYDRNPQRYVPNIFSASPSDYVRALVSLTVGGAEASFLELPMAEPN
jgi:putative CocE/NonD family hydrolase